MTALAFTDPKSSCLYSVVRNNKATALVASYLPPHGVTIPAGGEVAVFGNLIEWFRERRNSRRRAAFIHDLENGTIELLQTPPQHTYDKTLLKVSVLGIANGVVTVGDPCWGHYISSHGADL